MSDARPFTLLIAALGGEGGGVLTDWIVSAARSAAACRCSRPRSPASRSAPAPPPTTSRSFPSPLRELGGRRPVLALAPGVGDVDVVVASELLEAGRAIAIGLRHRRPHAAASPRPAASISRSRRCRWPTGATTASACSRRSSRTRKEHLLFDMEARRQAGRRDRQFGDARRDRGQRPPADPGRGVRGGDPAPTARRSRATCAAFAPASRPRATQTAACRCARSAKRPRSRRLPSSKPKPPRCRRPRAHSPPKACAASSPIRTPTMRGSISTGSSPIAEADAARQRGRQAARRDRAASRGAHVVRGCDPRRRGQDRSGALPPHRGRDRRQGSALRHHGISQARHRGVVPGAAAAACARDRGVFGEARLARHGLFRHGAEDHDRVGLSCASGGSRSSSASARRAGASPRSRSRSRPGSRASSRPRSFRAISRSKSPNARG